MRVLKELDYKVDSSVTPFINWSKLVKGAPQEMDFTQESLLPHLRVGLIEVPMSIIPVSRWGVKLGPLGNKLFYKKVWGRIFREVEARELEQAVEAAKKIKLPFFQFMTHSSELMPGGSIYNKTPEAVEQFYLKLEQFFTYLKQQDINSVGLGSIVETDIKTSR